MTTEYPKLPFWFFAGRAAVSIDGPVYVLKDDGSVVGSTGPAVLAPRTKFFATSQATSHLVSRNLVKRLADPKPPEKKKEEAVVQAPAATKSVAVAPEPVRPTQQTSASSEPEKTDAVIASGSGEGAAGSTVPEEQESRSVSRSQRARTQR